MKSRAIITAFVLLALMTTQFPSPCRAEEPKSYSWSDKFTRGVVNIFTSPIEVARQIHETTEEKSLAVGWTVGLAEGVASALIRFGAGAIDVLTCPFNFPEGHKGPLVEPEYVWERPGPKYV